MSTPNNDQEPVLKGSCACGAISFSSTLVPAGASICHCSICRKISGAPFLAFVTFPNEVLSWSSLPSQGRKAEDWTDSADTVLLRRSDWGIRATCKRCGSPLWMKYHCAYERTSVPMGLIDEASVRGSMSKVNEHIFVDDKVSWFPLPDDGVPRYGGFDAPFLKRMEEWKNAGCPKREDIY